MILPIAILLVCQLVGESLTRALLLPLPGPVLGMALLLIAFAAIPRLPAMMMPVAHGLLGHLSLLFVPAGVGVISHLGIMGDVGPALLLTILVSTVLALIVSVLTFVLVAMLCGDTYPASPEAS